MNANAANADEVLTAVSIDLATGTVALDAQHFAAAAALTPPLQCPGGVPLVAVGGVTNHNSAAGVVDLSLDANTNSVIATLAGGSDGHKLACMAVAVVAIQLAADGHDYLTANEGTNALISDFDPIMQDYTGLIGCSLQEMKGLIFHQALHSLDPANILAFGTSGDTESASFREVGEDFDPIPIGLGRVARRGGKQAALKSAGALMTRLGAATDLHHALPITSYLTSLSYAQRTAPGVSADLKQACETLDPLIAQLAGFLAAWTKSSGTKETAVSAKSIQRLRESHGTQWAIGAAQEVLLRGFPALRDIVNCPR